MVVYSRSRLPYGKPFTFAEGGRKVLKSFTPTGAQTCDFTEINIRMIDKPAAEETCGRQSQKPAVTITVRPGGFCCLDPLTIEVPWDDINCPDDFGRSVMCALASDPRLGGYGVFQWNSETLSLTFKARTPGFEVDFDVIADKRYVEYCVRTRGTQKSEGFRPGQLVVHAPQHVLQGDPFKTIFAPTTDLSAADSDECLAGIVISCPNGIGEQAPVSYQTGFPIASNCDSPCGPPPSCVRVLKSGPPMFYELMDCWTEGCCLYYNYLPEEGNPDTGMLYANPGPGRAALKNVMDFSIEGMHEGGRVLEIRFGR